MAILFQYINAQFFKFILLVIMTCWFSRPTHAQLIHSIVVDNSNREPIFGAYVFIDNSSIGTTTNADGYWELEENSLKYGQLVISHLNYELHKVPVSQDIAQIDTIFLKPDQKELTNIVLKAKKKPRLRKKRLHRFTNALLGETREARKSKILNPEVLLFKEENNVLTATATEPISIKNDFLGYNLKFFLDQFELQSNDDGIFSGKISFVPIDSIPDKQLAQYQKNRRVTFENSREYFFKNLIDNTIDKENFSLATCALNYKYEFIKIGSLTFDSLELKVIRDDIYEIPINHYLAVRDQSNEVKRLEKQQIRGRDFRSAIKQKKNKSDQSGTSYITSKSQRIIVNSEGIVLNPKDLIEYGKWSEHRLGTMLPMDYSVSEDRQ